MKTKMKMKTQQLINISRVWVCVLVCVLCVDSSRPVAASVADTSLEMIMESLHPPRKHRLPPNLLSPHPPCDYPKMLTEALVVNLSTYKQIFFLNMRKLWMLWQWGKVGGALCLVKSENWVCKVFLQFFVSFFLHFAMGRFLDLPISQHCCCLEFARVCLLGVWAYLSCVCMGGRCGRGHVPCCHCLFCSWHWVLVDDMQAELLLLLLLSLLLLLIIVVQSAIMSACLHDA